ncbi:FecR family protein [Sphingobacterium suaedae]|uniref:FecR family protein n=1 Tax=Sphingobacterium suaedae TaxID=1686402 RepID=A0ABW5KM96_9SPHI
MDTNPFEIAEILAKKSNGDSISDAEELILSAWLKQDVKNRALYDELLTKNSGVEPAWMEHIDAHGAWRRIQQRTTRKNRLSIRWAVAASLLVALSIGGYLWLPTRNGAEQTRIVESTAQKYTNDVLPANLGAKIILASGEEVKVDDTLSVAHSVQLMDGRIREPQETLQHGLTYHTLLVPAANFFKLTLADGTTVWVNSNSELRFPTHFSEDERRVYLRGEAYFEVAKDAAKPFYVETSDIHIRVLGTHFNVSTYGDRSKTSLAEGRVEISNHKQSVVISPGQSAEWRNGNLQVKSTNLQKDLAWKNNEFYFQEDNIVHIAHQLKLWYDLDISFSDDVSLTTTYSGEIRRDVRLTEVLKMLEFVSDLDFKLNKNKLLITKNQIMK